LVIDSEIERTDGAETGCFNRLYFIISWFIRSHSLLIFSLSSPLAYFFFSSSFAFHLLNKSFFFLIPNPCGLCYCSIVAKNEKIVCVCVDSHRASGGTRPDAVLYSPTHEGPDRTLIDVACADTSKELSKKKVKKVGDFLKRVEERKFSKYENRKKIQITANFAAAARGVQESLTAFHQEIKVIIGSDVNGLKPFAVTTIGSFGQQARALLSSMRRNESSGEMDMRDSSGASM
ncbi:hypothetical protein ADUPG1_004972, partial [Aduncisulcus paluster]